MHDHWFLERNEEKLRSASNIFLKQSDCCYYSQIVDANVNKVGCALGSLTIFNGYTEIFIKCHFAHIPNDKIKAEIDDTRPVRRTKEQPIKCNPS